MADTFNEHAYKFYQDGLTILKEIKANTDEIMLKQEQTMSLQEHNLKQAKMANVYLESMTDLRLTEDDII